MSYITTPRGFSSRVDLPTFDPTRLARRAKFARQATLSVFGRHAWALDQADFVDRRPGDMPHVP